MTSFIATFFTMTSFTKTSFPVAFGGCCLFSPLILATMFATVTFEAVITSSVIQMEFDVHEYFDV